MENLISQLRDKTDELMRRAISKVVQCILLSRIEVLQQHKKINKHFHIETEDSESIQKLLDTTIFARNGIRTLFLLEIHFDEGGELLGINTLLESWRFVFEPFKEVDTTFELPKLYRNVILLVRTLYSFLRNVPSFSVYRNFTKNRSTTSKIKYQIRICDMNSILSPSFSLSTPTKSFIFTSIATPLGIFKLDVNYKDDLSKEISISSQLGLDSQFIIKDYNNNHFKSEPQPIIQNQQQQQQYQTKNYYNQTGSYGTLGSNSTSIPTPSQSLPIKVQPQYYPQPYGGGSSGGRSSGTNLISSDPYKPSSVGSSDSYDYYGGGSGVGSGVGNTSGGSGVGSYNSNSFTLHHQYLQQQQQDKSSNPIVIPNNNLYGSKRNSPGTVIASPQASTSPPFSVNTNNSYPKSTTLAGSPPFGSSNPQQILHPSYPLTIRQVTPQISNNNNPGTNISPNQHRHRSISAPTYQQYPLPPQTQPLPIQQHHQQQQQQHQQQQYGLSFPRSGRSPPTMTTTTNNTINSMNIHTGFSPPNNAIGTSPLSYKDTFGVPTTQQLYSNPTGSLPNQFPSNTINYSNNSNSSNNHSSSSFKNSINSKLSQIHGPLLLTDVHKELQVKNTIENVSASVIDTEEPVFASSIGSSSKTSDSEVGEFVRLCKIAPPLKLFDTNYSTEAPLRIDQDVLELNKVLNK